MQLDNFLKVTAPNHFAGFLTAMNIPFFYHRGAFYIYRNSKVFAEDAYSFRLFCLTRGVRDSDLQSISSGNFTINLD